MDEDFIEMDSPYQQLGRISVIVGIFSLLSLVIPQVVLFAPIAVIIGVIALCKGQKTGWRGIAMGAISITCIGGGIYWF